MTGLERGMHLDPGQVPTTLKAPATQPGQPPAGPAGAPLVAPYWPAGDLRPPGMYVQWATVHSDHGRAVPQPSEDCARRFAAADPKRTLLRRFVMFGAWEDVDG